MATGVPDEIFEPRSNNHGEMRRRVETTIDGRLTVANK
jgi:hypothetical protein